MLFPIASPHVLSVHPRVRREARVSTEHWNVCFSQKLNVIDTSLLNLAVISICCCWLKELRDWGKPAYFLAYVLISFLTLRWSSMEEKNSSSWAIETSQLSTRNGRFSSDDSETHYSKKFWIIVQFWELEFKLKKWGNIALRDYFIYGYFLFYLINNTRTK